MTKRIVTLEVIKTVNDQNEHQPDRYKVKRTATDFEKEESIEFGSFQQALQAFINRLH